MPALSAPSAYLVHADFGIPDVHASVDRQGNGTAKIVGIYSPIAQVRLMTFIHSCQHLTAEKQEA